MNIKKQNKKKKGFTLIELIVVIAIIAILAAIAIPNYLSIQRKAKVKADIASAKTIYNATAALITEGKFSPDNKSGDFSINLEFKDGTIINGGKSPQKPSATKPGEKTDADNLKDYLQTIPKAQSIGKDATKDFSVSVSGTAENPDIEVKINDKEVYPEAEGVYKLN